MTNKYYYGRIMIKKFFILICLIFIFISSVSANDNNTEIGNFTELTNQINDSNGSLLLDKDYSEHNDTVNVSKSLTSDDNNHSISLNNNLSFKINENNLSLTFKNNFFATYDNESNITSFNLTLIDCHLQPDYTNTVEVHNYGDDWGYGYSCKVSRKIKNLAFKIIGKSEGLIAAKKLTLWVRKNIKKEINAGFYQKPSKTLKRKLGNCCCKVELLLQMMDAVGLRKNHKLYFVHVGNKMYHHRHFFAMIDHICVDPTLKRPWGRGGFYGRKVVIIPYPILPLPYGHYA